MDTEIGPGVRGDWLARVVVVRRYHIDVDGQPILVTAKEQWAT